MLLRHNFSRRLLDGVKGCYEPMTLLSGSINTATRAGARVRVRWLPGNLLHQRFGGLLTNLFDRVGACHDRGIPFFGYFFLNDGAP